MQLNPFVYQAPTPPNDLIDRAEELKELSDLVEGGHFVRMVAPRRYGKTSLLWRLAEDCERDLGIPAVRVDFYSVLSLADVAIRLEEAYTRSLHGPLRKFVRDLMRTWNIGVNLGIAGLAARFEANPKTDPLPALHRLLELPAEVAAKHGGKVVVIFDEFQDLYSIEGAEGIIRSHIQHHAGRASYIFAGSEPRLMERIFSDRSRPMLGQAHPVNLGPLPPGPLANYIINRFEINNRQLEDKALDGLLALVDGHPQRAMMMAHYLFKHTKKGHSADLATFGDALDDALSSLTEGLERTIRSMTPNQQRVMNAIALSPDSIHSQMTASRFGIKRTSIPSTVESLVATGDLREDPDLRIVDPFLAYWLRQKS